MGNPRPKGIKKVSAPKAILLFLLALNKLRSNSNPAINMIYSKPMVEKISTNESSSMKKFNPFGPIIIPAIINPIMPGILILFKILGIINMMNRIKENIITGFVSGGVNPSIKCVNVLFSISYTVLYRFVSLLFKRYNKPKILLFLRNRFVCLIIILLNIIQRYIALIFDRRFVRLD